jgi:hypothetical protein
MTSQLEELCFQGTSEDQTGWRERSQVAGDMDKDKKRDLIYSISCS